MDTLAGADSKQFHRVIVVVCYLPHAAAAAAAAAAVTAATTFANTVTAGQIE